MIKISRYRQTNKTLNEVVMFTKSRLNRNNSYFKKKKKKQRIIKRAFSIIFLFFLSMFALDEKLKIERIQSGLFIDLLTFYKIKKFE
jgi:hypothetical protein